MMKWYNLLNPAWFCTNVFTLCGSSGGGGGDGGAQARQDKEDARVAEAVKRINEVFGLAEAIPNPVDKTKFNRFEELVSNGSVGLSGVLNGSFGAGQEVWQPVNSQNSGILDFLKDGSSGGSGGGGFMGGSQNNRRTRKVFDEAGYNAAVAESQAKADSLKGAAAGRERLYSTIAGDTTNRLLTDLNKDRAVAERELNFNLSRNGLNGGSRDIDSNRDLLDTFNQGALKAADIGRQTGNDARIKDDNTRTNLITSVRAGLDEGSALQQSYEGLRNNATTARDDANAQSLNGFFATIRNELDKSQYQQGFQQASNQFEKKYPVNNNRDFKGTVR